MKLNGLVLALIATSSVTAFAGQSADMDSECAMSISTAVIAAQGGGTPDEKGTVTITENDRKDVVISDTKEIRHSSHRNQGDMPSWTELEAKVSMKNGGMSGKVRVEYTRAGCTVTKLAIEQK